MMNILELIYYCGYRISQSTRVLRRKRLNHPVVSVGNITLGGTGKTPAVIAIAEEALRRGYRPCILTRGYRGSIRKPVVVSRGGGALYGPKEAGDEAVLMAERLRGVEIVKAPNRHAGALLSNNADLFIIDDGFQHRQLARDRDVLLIDSIDPFGNGRLIPLGILREPLKQIGKADIIVITRSAWDASLIERLKAYNGTARYFSARITPIGLVKQNGDTIPVTALTGKRIFAFCAIGNPGGFARTLLGNGTALVGMASYRDHHVYSARDIEAVVRDAEKARADLIVTTEKDLVKLGDIALPDSAVALRIAFETDRDFYDTLFAFKDEKTAHVERRQP